jgi:predicted transcriptional regulator
MPAARKPPKTNDINQPVGQDRIKARLALNSSLKNGLVRRAKPGAMPSTSA